MVETTLAKWLTWTVSVSAMGQRQIMSHLRIDKIRLEEHSICFVMFLPKMPILNLIIEETPDKPTEGLSTIAGLSFLEVSRSGMSRKD